MVLAIVDDLIFRGKLETAAAQLGAPLALSMTLSGIPQPGQAWSRIPIDLNLSTGDALDIVRALRQAHPSVPVIGYYAHVQEALGHAALDAGCSQVLPRSAFIRDLPRLLAG